ncbi:hypothetical protein MPH_13970 [Macrophomina phaseolina MS6]|uniref:Uncharacterized protein n=1 Tax=Macrophomina phaseolina (strain MS6) TaxID=1126212 RepID=K2QH43_MACPH|nr:hypothetical protein MPH_13970 [Macrophomina phaseolina MS6]
MPYFSFTERTRSNHRSITTGSSFKARWQSYARVQQVLSSSLRLMNLSGQVLPTVPAPRSASSLLAISRSISFEGGNPLESRSSIRSTIATSSNPVSFLQLGSTSARGRRPLRRACTVDRGARCSRHAARSLVDAWVSIACKARLIYRDF